MDGTFSLDTRQVAMTAIWAAVYAVALLIPFSQFIGGAGFITLGIIMVPVFCKMLKPVSAMVAGVFGMVIAASIGAAIVPVYGLFSFVIPLTAGLLGSLAFHYRFGCRSRHHFLGNLRFPLRNLQWRNTSLVSSLRSSHHSRHRRNGCLQLQKTQHIVVENILVSYNWLLHLLNDHYRKRNNEPWKRIHFEIARRPMDSDYACIHS